MRLFHYSADVMQFEPLQSYVPQAYLASIKKPNGLWLSIGDSWKQQMGHIPSFEAGMRHVQEFELLSPNNVLIVDTNSMFDLFIEIYSVESITWMDGKPFNSVIDWIKVARSYDGILFKWLPKQRSRHLWYYGWDCEGGCIWNLNVIKPVSEK